MTTNNESFVIRPLIATSLSVTWHLPGTRSLAGAGDVALRGCSCHVMVCCGGRGSSMAVVGGGGDW